MKILIFLFITNVFAGGNIPFGFMPAFVSSINPTSLVLTHTTRSKNFTFSWTGGSGNDGVGGCRIQYYKNNSTWTNVGTTYNCDSNESSVAVTLAGDGWTSGNFNSTGVSVRIIRISDSAILGTFGSNLTCTATGGSSSSTPTIDEDCDGSWDNTSLGVANCEGLSPVASNGGEVPGAAYACPASDNTNSCTGKTTIGFSYLKCSDSVTNYATYSDCNSQINSTGSGTITSANITSISGTIPSTISSAVMNGYSVLDYSCPLSVGQYRRPSAGNYWNWGCFCNYDYNYNIYN